MTQRFILLAATLLVATPAAAQADSVGTLADRSRSRGSASATITVAEVSDFQCPFCRQFFETTYPRLDSAYIATGRARLVYVNYPLPNHPLAFAAAEAALCAGVQGKFWPMHDRLFAAQREWTTRPEIGAYVEGLASELGLRMDGFRDCVAHDRTAAIIVSDAMNVAGARVTGTPTFIVSGPGGQRVLGGAVPWEDMRAALEAVAVAPVAAPAPGTPPQP